MIMKIISVKNFPKENLEKSYPNTSSLPKRLSPEEASEKGIPIYISADWYTVIKGKPICFVFLSFRQHQVYGEDENQLQDCLYSINLWADSQLFDIELPKQEIYNSKWLKQLHTKNFILISKSQYELLLQAIQPDTNSSFYFEKIGIHQLYGKYYYAASNCAITSEGIDKSIKAMQEGFNLEIDSELSLKDEAPKKSIENFMDYTAQNYRVFYPIHCISILAVLRYFLKKLGRSAGAVLWIDGKVASGKTQLAVTMGDFFNRSSNWEDQIKHLQTTKSKPKLIAAELSKYRNAVFILDDIKKEETSGSRDNTKNITDLLIRSIYTGKTGGFGTDEQPIDAAAVITGEYFKEIESTSSRLLYLNIDDFLQKETNSNQFKNIQKDKSYLAKFMSYFIQWLFQWIEDINNAKFLETTLTNLQNDAAECFHGELSTRMAETLANFQLVSEILNEYFKENQIPKIYCTEFHKKSRDSLKNLAYATLYKSLNYYPLIEECFYKTLSDLKIKDCRYGEHYLNIALSSGNDHLLHIAKAKDTDYLHEPGASAINYDAKGEKKLWLLGLQEGYDGIMLNIKECNVLLVKSKVLCSLIREKIKSDIQKWHIKLYHSDMEDERILNTLLEHHCIYGYKRRDNNSFDKIINYPEFSSNQNLLKEYHEKPFIEQEQMHHMVKINIANERIYNRITDIKKPAMDSFATLFSAMNTYDSSEGRHFIEPNDGPYMKNLKDIFAKINRFSDLR